MPVSCRPCCPAWCTTRSQQCIAGKPRGRHLRCRAAGRIADRGRDGPDAYLWIHSRLRADRNLPWCRRCADWEINPTGKARWVPRSAGTRSASSTSTREIPLPRAVWVRSGSAVHKRRGILEAPRRYRVRLPHRRMVPHRRHRPVRHGRVPAHSGSAERHDHFRG
jgi:hypothetical protein